MILFTQIMEQEDNNKKVGSIIKSIRERESLTQDELSNRIGTNQEYISRIELGRANSSYEFALKVISLARSEEIPSLLSHQSVRRNNLRKSVLSATAILEGLSLHPECPVEARQLLEQFLPRWRLFLNNHYKRRLF